MAVNANQSISNILFLVGIGANAEIYQPFLQELQHQYPHAKLQTLVWWQEQDLGMKSIHNLLQDKKTLLIGHSAGGVIALKTFQQWPQLVQKIVMLDSHIIHQTNKLPSIEKMLSVMLEGDTPATQKIVQQAYAQVVQDDTQFYQAFHALVQWVNSDFELVAARFNSMPKFVLHVGFTDCNYKKYEADAMRTEQEVWGKFGIDVRCLPMNHFDLIEPAQARVINKLIADWH